MIATAGVILLLVSCAHVVPESVRKNVDTHITAEMLFKNPKKYIGKTVMLGGEILQTTNVKNATLVEVLQRPLDSLGRPQYEELSKGRFMVKYNGFLDPAVYKKGRLVTVVGTVEGTVSGKIGQMVYEYPLLTSKHLYLIKPYSGPSVGIGIGIGFFHD